MSVAEAGKIGSKKSILNKRPHPDESDPGSDSNRSGCERVVDVTLIVKNLLKKKLK